MSFCVRTPTDFAAHSENVVLWSPLSIACLILGVNSPLLLAPHTVEILRRSACLRDVKRQFGFIRPFIVHAYRIKRCLMAINDLSYSSRYMGQYITVPVSLSEFFNNCGSK